MREPPSIVYRNDPVNSDSSAPVVHAFLHHLMELVPAASAVALVLLHLVEPELELHRHNTQTSQHSVRRHHHNCGWYSCGRRGHATNKPAVRPAAPASAPCSGLLRYDAPSAAGHARGQRTSTLHIRTNDGGVSVVPHNHPIQPHARTSRARVLTRLSDGNRAIARAPSGT